MDRWDVSGYFDGKRKGYDPVTGLYSSRYYANLYKMDYEIAVKVDGGYKLMSYNQYRNWLAQK